MMYSIGDYGDMIADHARMDPYVYALKALVEPGSIVLDIGTGTGMHALLACKIGARKVYALEPNEAIHLARELARENGYADRIEFIQDISTRVSLPEKADIIVSDLRGALPLQGGHIPDIIDARERFLAPGGVMIPKRDTIWVSLVESSNVYNDLAGAWDYPYGMSMKRAEEIVLNDWREEDPGTFNKRSLLVDPQIWAEIDYAIIDNPEVNPSRIVQSATRDGTAHGLLMWFDGEIADGNFVYNGPMVEKAARVYGCAFFPLLEPVAISAGDSVSLNIQAEYSKEHYYWTWQTQIFSGGNSQTLKANFEQSSKLDTLKENRLLHNRVLNFKPSLGKQGEIDYFILGEMDGSKSIDEIARRVRQEYPSRFKSQIEAELYVNALSMEYGR